MNEPCIITIGGDLGSGKSTVARMLAESLGTARYSTGDLQRRMAESLGLTSLELNKKAETDPTIDRAIDSSTVEIAAKEPRVVFDSRLAWHFVPSAFKVYLTVDPVVGAQRILNAGRGKVEEYESLEEAMTRLTERRASEDKRFSEIYHIEMNRVRNYNLIIDSTYVTPELVARNIAAYWCVAQNQPGTSGHGSTRVVLSPKTPFPTRDRNEDRKYFYGEPHLHLIRYGAYYFIGEHSDHLLSHALTTEKTLIEGSIEDAEDAFIYPESPEGVDLLAEDAPDEFLSREDDFALSKPNGIEFLLREATPKRARAWEARHQFRYASDPPHFRLFTVQE